jgi:predicted ribosome quality control (RQC) complex YloA/Tae2 family protein|tara:strand:+ start:519 stop:1052 length:534 start_codon:yes stop_codon:yes gene_type:complete
MSEEKEFVPLEEYFSNDIDFGFTAVESDEDDSPPPVTTTTVTEASTEIISSIEDKFSRLESKMNILLDREDEPDVNSDLDMSRIEEKIDKILSMENTELASSIQEQGESIRAIIDEVEERKREVELEIKEKMIEIEKLTLPLLYNLMKNDEKEHIYWPGRKQKLESQISKIISVTRG